MQKQLRKILGTVKYSDETWVDVLERVNKDVGIDIKTCYKLIGVILDELERSKIPVIPTVFPTEETSKKMEEYAKKETATKKGK